MVHMRGHWKMLEAIYCDLCHSVRGLAKTKRLRSAMNITQSSNVSVVGRASA